jgi:hypothetical protein
MLIQDILFVGVDCLPSSIFCHIGIVMGSATAQSLRFTSWTMISIKPNFGSILRRYILFVLGPETFFGPGLELAGQIGFDSISFLTLFLRLS